MAFGGESGSSALDTAGKLTASALNIAPAARRRKDLQVIVFIGISLAVIGEVASLLQTRFGCQTRHPADRWHGTGSQDALSWLPMSQLTDLLSRVQAGDARGRDALFTAAYGELHRLAHVRLRDGGRNAVLDTTCLVHESYLRFVSAGELRAEDRRAFFAYASQVMRSVIVNSVREHLAQKRGGDQVPLTLSHGLAAEGTDAAETVLAVHEALEALEQADPRLAEVAQMRYFGGYSEQEIAATLAVTERTVQRDWEKARLILAAALR
jgi:RNA polymerase sigma factor (TIGR02999 family)